MQVETPTTPSVAELVTSPLDTPADEVATSDVNEWAEFTADTDDAAGTVEGEFEIEADATPVEPAPVVEAPQPVVQEPVAPVAAEPVTPVPPPAPVVPEPQAQPTQPVQTYADWRTQQEGNLEKHYALDEDTARALLTEPETVLPKLAARVHLEVTENVLRAVQNLMPGMFEQMQTAKTVESEAEKTFYAQNEDLRSVPKDKILQIGAMFRQVNPNATASEAVIVIGNMVRTALGMGAPAPVAQTPAAPVATVQPFVPTRGGGGAGTRTPVQSNPWAELLDQDN